jgi:hypothetical protein
LLLYLAALWFTFRNVFWFRARSRVDPTGTPSAIGLALLLSLTGLCVNLTFSSNAYFSYLPTLMGLSVAFRRSLQQDMAAQKMAARIEFPRPSSTKPVYHFLGRPPRARA